MMIEFEKIELGYLKLKERARETHRRLKKQKYGRLSTENLTKNFELKMELMNSIEILTIAINDL